LRESDATPNFSRIPVFARRAEVRFFFLFAELKFHSIRETDLPEEKAVQSSPRARSLCYL
jgi:hypothetical protein